MAADGGGSGHIPSAVRQHNERSWCSAHFSSFTPGPSPWHGTTLRSLQKSPEPALVSLKLAVKTGCHQGESTEHELGNH